MGERGSIGSAYRHLRIQYGRSMEANPERQARYRWAAQLVGDGKVLDAACGRGWGTAVLAESGVAVVGVDLSPAAIADAREEHGAAASFRQGHLEELPFADGEFDHVVCFEALTQATDPERAVGQLSRVLRSGGLLLISAPNRGAYPPGNPLQQSEIDSEELERMLAARFSRVAVHRQHSYHASLLGPPELQAVADPGAPLSVSVRKAGGGAPGEELHAVAVATDGELPAEPASLVLGEQLDYNRQQALLEEWQERAVRAEATVLSQSRKLRALRA